MTITAPSVRVIAPDRLDEAPPPHGLARFGLLLRTPQAPRLLTGFAVGRLPTGFMTLALLLAVAAATGSVAVGAAVVAGYTLALAASAPMLGRAVDRHGARTVLRRAAAAHTGLLLVAAVVLSGPQPLVAVVPAILAGAVVPPLPAALRSRWPQLLGDDPARRETALCAEAVIVEGCYLLGPLVAAATAASGRPTLAIVIAAGCVAVGTAVFTRAPATEARAAVLAPRDWAGPLRSRSVRRLLAAAVSSAAALSLLTTAVAAQAARDGRPALAGVALAAAGVVSLGGALAWGAVSGGRRPVQAVALLGLALTVAAVPLLVSPDWTGALVALLLAHVCVSGLFASVGGWAADAAPPGRTAETFTWLTSASLVGAAAGSSVGGIAPLALVGLLAAACALASSFVAARQPTVHDPLPTRS